MTAFFVSVKRKKASCVEYTLLCKFIYKGEIMAKIYELSAHGYTAQIVADYGMNCIKITHETGVDVLRTPDDADVLQSKVLYGMPVLFFPNRISGGRFEFEGREYVLPINEPKLNNFCHGDLHKLAFDVTECDKTHIIGVYTASDENRYMTFPHTFEFKIEYEILSDGVHQNVSVKNTSDKNMPFALAFHTTFNLNGGDRVKIPVRRKVLRNFETYLPTGEFEDAFDEKNALLHGGFQPYGTAVSALYEVSDGGFVLYKSKENAYVTYSVDEKYKYCMLFNGDGTKFVCTEPQTWITNCPNLPVDREKCGFDFIAPNAVKTYKSVIGVSKK